MATALTSSNASLHPPSAFYLYDVLYNCFRSKVGVVHIITYAITSILLLLPLWGVVLYVAYQRWRHQRSSMNHSDFFTCNMAAIDAISIVASLLSFCGTHFECSQLVWLGLYLFTINLLGQMLFQSLTCGERYLAAVHPVTYVGLRRADGIRNVMIGCAWLLCMVATGLMMIDNIIFMTTFSLCFIGFLLIVVSFFSVSVLCVLIRPAPGERGGDRKRFDQSKLRAFYTITIILGLLVLRFGGQMMAICLMFVMHLNMDTICNLSMAVLWFCFPSSLVIPLLFLHRVGKLPCCM